ncbi:MAG TPA: glycosyltransferase family 39 protein, partial [Bacteroidales bacterium]|nr:glycosyltransferase family 39 protein [Bacteroidales bacterium]
MKRLSEFNRVLPFYFFVGGVFLIIVCQNIFSNGMFLDGLIYSAVSKNLSNGIGTFWNLHFTETFMSDFHEHPPLAFGIQSIFYTFFGESRFVDKAYSIFTVILVAFIIVKIWQTLNYKHGWIPLFLWIITPTVFWSSYNNLLENTLTIFTSLSILFYLKGNESKNYLFIVLSGFMLTLGFLTKGFVAFFPWTFPFLLWIFLKRNSFGRMILDSAGLIIFSLLPLLIMILMFPAVKESLLKYINNQVIGSIKSVVTVDSRVDIVKRMFSEIVFPASLCIIFLLWGKIRTSLPIFLKENTRKSLVFVSLGLTGVLPIMVSLKQSGFYILPVYPFFAIGISILIYPLLDSLFIKMNYNSKGFILFKWIAYGLFISGLVLSIYFSDHFSRDKNRIKDMNTILAAIPRGSVININPVMFNDWALHAYLDRFKD